MISRDLPHAAPVCVSPCSSDAASLPLPPQAREVQCQALTLLSAAALYSPAAAVPRARLAQTATATLFHLPAGPEAPPAVVRVTAMGPALEQSATSMLLQIPAAVRRPPHPLSTEG